MSFVRPEVRAGLWRWREALIGSGLIALGLYWALVVHGLIGWIGWAVVPCGAALAITGIQRARFRGRAGGLVRGRAIALIRRAVDLAANSAVELVELPLELVEPLRHPLDLPGDLPLDQVRDPLGPLPAPVDQRLDRALGVGPLHLPRLDQLPDDRLGLRPGQLGELDALLDQPLQR